MPDDKVQIFTAPFCGGCEEVKDAVAAGQVEVQGVPGNGHEVELVDLSSDEGYALVEELGLETVPAAFYQGQRCELLVDDEAHKVVVRCGAPPPESAPAPGG